MKGLFWLFLLVIALQIVLGFAIYTQIPNWSDRGTFGDMFGAVNTLFSGLAFVGVIYAIFLQGKELQLQREELKLTRDELAKAASAQSSQSETMLKAAKINAIGAEIQCYSQLLAGRRSVPGGDTSSSSDSLAKALAELEALVEKT